MEQRPDYFILGVPWFYKDKKSGDHAGWYASLFTEEMDKVVEARYPTENTEKLAKELGVTVKQLNGRAGALGVYKKTRARTACFWTEERDALLREKYPRMVSADIAKEWGISKSAVTTRASLLGIKKDVVWLKKQRRMNYGTIK